MMLISRRDFLRYCSAAAAALGLSGTDLLRLQQVLADPNAPTVVWLAGSSCSGCSVSFLNYIAATDPTDAGDILLHHVNLAYHPVVMAPAGLPAYQAAEAAYTAGGYVLVVEGAVATQFGGRCCWPWSNTAGEEETFQAVVSRYVGRALKVVCAGSCAAFGGIPAAGSNPTLATGVQAATGKTTLNIPGCPCHPNWLVWALVQILLGNGISVDSFGRPTALFGKKVHENCPRKGRDKDKVLAGSGCLRDLGCRGPDTEANCPAQKWNNAQSWCIEASAPCYGCTEPDFPGSTPFYKFPAE